MTAGLSRYVPFSTSGQMGATPYLFRSGFNAGISFGEDCRPAGYPLELLKQAIAEGKRIRKYYRRQLLPARRGDHQRPGLVRDAVPPPGRGTTAW